MCNRFRVICSAILIARLSNRKLYHSWSKERSHEADISIIQHMRESTLATFFTEDLVVPFCETDATTAVDEVFSEWGPGEYWYPMQSSAIRRCCWSSELNVERSNADAILDSQADNILLETSLCLKPTFMTESEFELALSDIYVNHFKPLPTFQGAVERFTQNKTYVGVHIRRTDHLQHIREANISVKNWAKIIRQRVRTDEAIYICSDDKPFAKAVTRLLTEYKILRVEEVFSEDPKINAYLEFLCLSKASRIYGTVGSSFSREAALFGGRGFVLCSAKRPENIWGRLFDYIGIYPQRVECCERPALKP